jgi:serine/threonine protein phosphatase PrpC
MDNLP